jgi:hypothetical protein
MPVLLHDPKLFHAKLDSLRKAGGRAEDAPERARSIIRVLADRRQLTRRLHNKLTPQG